MASASSSSPPTLGIAVVGCGIIGSAVADALLNESALFKHRAGVTLQLRHVVEKDTEKALRAKIPQQILSDSIAPVLKDKRTQVVVELIGGLEPARTFVLQALKAGKHVVTANKYLLATHGVEIAEAARKAKRCVQFEASCGGAIPIVAALSESLLANDITRVVGIVNGTCNYILTQMTQHGQTYVAALAGAQAAGFAERDPTFDVNGTDSAHKLAILSSLAFGVEVPLNRIEVTGIDKLSDVDLKFAKEFGYVCKLLAIGEKTDGNLSLRVHPTFVSQDRLLANVHGSFNAISVTGHAAGETTYVGRGAGGKPTSSAVLADIIDIALGTAPLLFGRLPLLIGKPNVNIRFLPGSQVVSRNYLRVTAFDVPGVMAHITNILSRNNISLAGVNQHESKAGHPVPIIITTHESKDGDVSAAIKAIDQLKTITGNTVRIRVLA
ncbi:MAG: homoserine dehydrogenase [Phycisphaerales bacterium]|nr:homoserine dehydrogenase [Phycisphaerales bacterium]